MIRIIKKGIQLVLEYQASTYNDATWIDATLAQKGEVSIRRTFTFKPEDLLSEDVDIDAGEVFINKNEDSRQFLLGSLDEDYYRIDKNILGIKYDLLVFKNFKLNHNSFIAYRDISIFLKIDSIADEPIIIGGNRPTAIPEEEFEYLLKEFPTSTEMTHYAGARISRILKEYLGTMSDAQKKLSDYFKKRRVNAGRGQSKKLPTEAKILIPYELKKFEYIHAQLKEMLAAWEDYNEYDWQNIIAELLCIIFPKYITILKELEIKDFYSKSSGIVKRKIDFALVDVNGCIDIVEIKQPFEKCILSQRTYRDNYTPKKELSGSIMQAEKYIFYLSKWGIDGEKEILQKRQAELPPNFKIQITNPKALIILGRDKNFASDQQFDFEIIRRKYANMIDIITYDDLLRRLENIITMLARK